MDGIVLMDVSDIVFTNLLLDYEVWFRKLSNVVKDTLDTMFENQDKVSYLNLSYIKGGDGFKSLPKLCHI